MIRIISISPEIFQEGITQCVIFYKAKSRDSGKAKVRVSLAGSPVVWFIEHGNEVERLEEFDISLTNKEKEFSLTVLIKANHCDLPKAGFVKIEITDVRGNISSDNKPIIYE